MANDLQCYYESLVGIEKPIQVKDGVLDVRVRNLDPLETYTAKFFLWAKGERPMRVEIFKPGGSSEIIKEFQFTLKPKLNSQGHGTWTIKKYGLAKIRQDGEARIVLGWPKDHPTITTDIPFVVMADTLFDKGRSPVKRLAQGLCPQCGNPGRWVRMAMVCTEHGMFMGC